MIGRFFRVKNSLKDFGIEPSDGAAMDAARQKWREMYLRRDGLGLAAAVCGELARLTTAEMKINVDGGRRGQYLNAAMAPFASELRRELEYALADGTMVFKPYYDGKTIKIDFVKGDCFTPVSWDESLGVTGAVFLQQLKRGNYFYTRREYHHFENGRYIIENHAYKSRFADDVGRRVELSEVDSWAELADRLVLENVKKPLFGVFRTPLANTVDVRSPLGASVFSRAEGLMEQADDIYKNFLWEFESGKRRLYVDITAFDRDEKGRLTFPDAELFRTIDVNNGGFFSEWSPEFRNEALQSGLNTILQRIEFNCSLAYGTISIPSYVEKTAEEVRMSKQRSYCFVCDLQSRLRTALEALLYAADVWTSVYGLAPEEKCALSVEFDDSVAADRRAEYEEKLELTRLGIIRPWEMRVWYLGEAPEIAKKVTNENELTAKENEN